MVQRSVFSGLDIAVASSDTGRIIYLLVPQGLSSDALSWIEEASSTHSCSIAVISGMDWNNDMTPWKAPGMFKKEKEFGGGANEFLEALESSIIPYVESILDSSDPVRILGGISLSGLFSVWASCNTNLFSEIISISGSLWYDNFVQWFKSSVINPCVKGIYITLGEREHNSRDKRLATVLQCTEQVVEHVKSQGVEVCFLSVPGTHFSPFIPRLEAVLSLIGNK